MGFRFSKRITIVPGVRLNISGSGISTSVGPRGLSLTMGKRGTYLNAGLPGTGLAYRERLDRSGTRNAPNPAADSAGYSGPIKVKVDDDGSLIITDLEDAPLPPAIVKRVKVEKSDEIQALLEKAAAKINQALNECLSAHMMTPRPGSLPALPPAFDLDEPRRPSTDAPGLLDKMLLRSSRMEKEAQELEAQYQQDLVEWNAARDAHEKARSDIDKAIRLAAKGYSAQMERALDYVLSGIAWPKETLLEYEFSHDVSGIALDIDLPDEGDVPNRTAEARGNGKLTFKTRSEAQTRKDFVSLCYGTVFRVVGEVFALLPGIQKCLASGYIQRTDLATGSIGDQYVISALISRDQWETLDFSRLEAIDPGATLKAFGAVVSVDRTSRFREITPMDLATLG
ncbi:DUF4236 domain-containing protein [Pseudomonas aeruginosa]|uniref:DUF4236 domain-containing protein n=7 Tax=Gammaproteobacteria TaxID=1236 RepID=D1KF71_PSEAI|nr:MULTISPECIES: DUF4236 domain-containing protein [Pseudomonas]ACY75539.1 hypothetical protein [Pseudomonas aeruginosa]ARG86549.1 hypothetical protein E613_24550 [Pseudomonas aeruginosa]ASA15097.1 hypothetical protein CDL16_13155 [Pseudomonas aeruginosa]ATE47478.1 hypothetical protein [Pseudomonas aeruginosa]AUA76870.1 DUF4236 domain-containing protein [Pseudomonas aeruginosa]|tara:strand:- start:283 stop:1476 length:1194 start_codon:yes stop_codon:yes gene_type:complete